VKSDTASTAKPWKRALEGEIAMAALAEALRRGAPRYLKPGRRMELAESAARRSAMAARLFRSLREER